MPVTDMTLREGAHRQRLNRLLQEIYPMRLYLRPPGGWVFTVRRTAGLSREHLGELLGISGRAVSKLERREAEGTASLNALRRAAEVMRCELLYVFLPYDTLDGMRREAVKKWGLTPRMRRGNARIEREGGVVYGAKRYGGL